MVKSAPPARPPVPAEVERPLAFYDVGKGNWEIVEAQAGGTPEEVEKEKSRAAAAKKSLHERLLTSLQMQHLMVLTGSGTSLGPVGGPSMPALWDYCTNENPGTGGDVRRRMQAASEVMAAVSYDPAAGKENIEELLSRCEALLQLTPSNDQVKGFVTNSKKMILDKCSGFLDAKKPDQLNAHRTFLHRLSRRRVRDSRLKVFTTNYDICFETAASKQGLVVIDGFSFSQPRYFDPRFFDYDIIRRTPTGGELGTPLEGVFQLYKLHGSVNWSRSEAGDIEVVEKPEAEKACLIYPAKGKYQQSYVQPHLEIISQYFGSLREPNTSLVAVGFGFNDDHLSEPILAAARTNPHLRLVVVTRTAREDVAGNNRYWKTLLELAKNGADVLLICGTFREFADHIPDLKSLTPAEQLARNVKALAGGN